ncbi:MAG: phospholipase D-like domain-containing protein [Paludibacter sp.]|nr:phospholipase D-like domain-containing protein [Paludibacter sp.]
MSKTMQTQAYFENIQEQIKQDLSKAKRSIVIAVAWFTDKELFGLICRLANQGINVQLLLMNDDINNQCGIAYELLQDAGGKVWKIGNGNNDTLMHNKFCVIDQQVVINGSYNWTNKAKQNHESITVIQDAELAYQFAIEFEQLKKRYFGESVEQTVLDYSKVCFRLETLKNAILLEDEDDINYQVNKLRKGISATHENEQIGAINDILNFTIRKNYGESMRLINEFTTRFRSITVYVDSEIMAMHLELKVLELQISSLEDERMEIEKLLFSFEIRHNQELGDLISKLLYLRKEKLNKEAQTDTSKKAEAEEAKKDYQSYNESLDEAKNEKIQELTEDELKEIKAKYRSASKLCHPDVVDEKYKEMAEQTFRELQKAYETNDLERVSEILSNLEKGFFTNKSEKENEKKELIATLNQLRTKRDELEKALVNLKTSETYKTVSEISDWDAYFENIKRQLEEEIGGMKAII